MTDKGKLFGFAIDEKSLSREELMFAKNKPKFTGDLQHENPMYVKELPPLKMIASGLEHMLALDRDGKVWAMGEDTFGQCGQGKSDREAVAPFFEVRHGKPVQVLMPVPDKVTKIACGFRHSLAITEKGHLFGWGFNSMQ